MNLEPGPAKGYQGDEVQNMAPKRTEVIPFGRQLQLIQLPDEEPIGAERPESPKSAAFSVFAWDLPRSDTPESQLMPVFHPRDREDSNMC